MKVGLIGFSQSGKSTLFQALTGVAPDPSAAMKGQIGISQVEDKRLDFLTAMYKPKKRTPATVEFIDTPGLIRGETADNPQRIATLRTADGLVVVLNGFSSTEDPAKQLSIFRDELVFSDLELITSRIERLTKGIQKGKIQDQRERDEKELADLKPLAAGLENGEDLHQIRLSADAQRNLRAFQLFSLKPLLVVLNTSEDNVTDPVPESLLKTFPQALTLAAKLEKDIADLDDADRPSFMSDLGVKEVARHRLIRAAYDAVKLISFFTVGEDECKAWTISAGTTAVEAAGKIHSDIQRGFIRAEITPYADLARLGNIKDVKAKGLQRLEGKEYLVTDGDIINFRFNV